MIIKKRSGTKIQILKEKDTMKPNQNTNHKIKVSAGRNLEIKNKEITNLRKKFTTNQKK